MRLECIGPERGRCLGMYVTGPRREYCDVFPGEFGQQIRGEPALTDSGATGYQDKPEIVLARTPLLSETSQLARPADELTDQSDAPLKVPRWPVRSLASGSDYLPGLETRPR